MGRPKKPTKNVHKCRNYCEDSNAVYFKCKKCGALLTTNPNTDEDSETYQCGLVYIQIEEADSLDYRYQAQPIIVDGIKFPSITKAANLMGVHHMGLRDALKAGRKYKGHTITYDDDPLSTLRSQKPSSTKKNVQVQYCPNCGRNVEKPSEDKVEVN